MPLTIGATVAAPVIGSVIGQIMSSDDEKKAEEARRKALEAFTNLHVPTIEEQRIQLQKLAVAGELDPQMEGAIDLGPSAMQEVAADPRLKAAQMRALMSLQDLGTKGLTSEDRVAMDETRRKIAGDANARDQAILQNMSARGAQGMGGNELAARLAASQNATNIASQEGDRAVAMAQSKALNALAQSGGLASQMNTQDFSQQSDRARAADVINSFNARNRQDVMSRNTSAANSAQQWNLTNKQRVADTNVGLSNTQETHNKGLHQTQFGNNLSVAQGVSGQQNKEAQAKADAATATRGMYSGIGQAAGTGIAAVGAHQQKLGDRQWLADQAEKDRIAKYGK